MESMSAPTYMYPGESPEEVLQRLVAYVNQEQVNQHHAYGQAPDAYQPTPAPEAQPLGRHAQYVTPPRMMEHVLTDLHRLDAPAPSPIEARRLAHAAPVRAESRFFETGSHPVSRSLPGEPAREVAAAPAMRHQRSATPHVATLRQPRRSDGRPAISNNSTGIRRLSEEELDRRFARFVEGWDEPDAPPKEKFRHRRQISRFEKISARLGLGLGFLAMAATVAYSGFELYSKARGQ